MGELGSFSKNKQQFSLINNAIHDYSSGDKNTAVISTSDLKDKGDSLSFQFEITKNNGREVCQSLFGKIQVGESKCKC
ncbi:MAG: hypothetical protein WDO71_00550 [Bacteroidota bacterium]